MLRELRTLENVLGVDVCADTGGLGLLCFVEGLTDTLTSINGAP